MIIWNPETKPLAALAFPVAIMYILWLNSHVLFLLTKPLALEVGLTPHPQARVCQACLYSCLCWVSREPDPMFAMCLVLHSIPCYLFLLLFAMHLRTHSKPKARLL